MNRLLSCAQSRRVDAIAIERFQLPGIVLMENAGRGCVELLEALLNSEGHAAAEACGPITILAGKGNNAGDGFVIARHLHNRGLPVRIILAESPAQFRGDAQINWRVVEAMQIECLPLGSDSAADWTLVESWLAESTWIVDALLGTGIQGDVRAPYARLIDILNSVSFDAGSNKLGRTDRPRVLAVDLPSGLNGDTGEICGVCVRAEVTATFVAAKIGMSIAAGPQQCGSIQVVDIGVPVAAIEQACKP